MDEMNETPNLRITWTPAAAPVVQAAEMIAFYAAHPVVAHDPSELDDFRL